MKKPYNPYDKGLITLEAPRSNKWPAFRRKFLKGKACAVCGGTKKLELHHIRPFHLFPKKELEASNVIPLCEGVEGWNHHFSFGHLGDWSQWNPSVVEDAARARRAIKVAKDRLGRGK